MEGLPGHLAGTAERHGDKPAFRFGADELTYGQLLERSNQLANALQANGVGAGDLVGVLMGKALENAVAVFGIMAAGAAYVPLDPAAPVARLEMIVKSCGLRHLVIDGERSGRAVKLCKSIKDQRWEQCFVYGVEELDAPGAVTTGWDELAALSSSAPLKTPAIDDLAYIIFTSGSTGAPKGIMHTHRSGVAYARMAAELYDVGPEDRLSNFPPLHFDQSTFDFFSGTMVGATTVMIGKEHQLAPASLSQLIERERLSIWYSVPLALVQLLLYGVLDERDCSALRWVVYGGEPFPLKHLKGLMDHWPHATFSNCYGPAETNQCTYYHVPPLTDEQVEADAGIPIGVACPGMETMIVDELDRRVEAGEAGELVVASPTTMAGYWGREDLNGAAFLDLPDSASPDKISRYYRTGDVVRRNDEGLLEFLGRRDRQIKTRGFRVELDEVEAVLSTHEDIEEVAVIATKADDETVAISAFLSLRPGSVIEATALQRHASARLPRYAVPTSVALVESFPRTTSGKIDYLALSATKAVAEGAKA